MKVFEGYTRGINLGGWLSQCDNTEQTYDNFIKEEDIKRISEWGLDHIRIPVDYNLVEDEQGNYREKGFEYIDKGVSWAIKYGMNAVLDLHKTFGFSFDFGEKEEGFFENVSYQERFYKLWEQFAMRFGKYKDHLAFELLNEVTDKEYCDAWNRISTECIERIRKICPDIKILIGGYYNNSIEALKDLCWPHDENVVYNFHCYEPLIFTHQGAYWIPTMDLDFRIGADLTYGDIKKWAEKLLDGRYVGIEGFDPAAQLSSEYFSRLFQEAVEVAEERNVRLYCGEYGVVDRVDTADIVRWYQMIHQTFEKYGIGRAAWNYRGKDFGFVDEHMSDVLDEVIKLL
ncbi:MAG: cellulase family glycosylhydrolase [Erysipelotrichaceae bacterium]|nr:cellulase family glycosylhydrolase [Erysipelotrichaceae bacterium]